MKLLGWMHRKFRQNSTEPFKDLVIGKPAAAVDDNYNYSKPKQTHHHHHSHVKQTHHTHFRKSFAGVETARGGDDHEYGYAYDAEEAATARASAAAADMYDYELFPGFLAIGTLGGANSEPSRTPTFAANYVVENITDKEEEVVTENELRLINDELEKVLESSGRNSHVSTGRSSHAGTTILTTLSGTGTGTECPLQEYLFGSAIELSETTTAAVAKKDHRTSLGELFQRSKLADHHHQEIKPELKDDIKINRSSTDKQDKEADKSAIHLMKKLLKKRILLHASSRSTTTSVDSASADRKPHKILHMFHKKVHPEDSTTAPKSHKWQKNEIKKKTINDGGSGHHKSDGAHPEEDIMMIHPKRNTRHQFTLVGTGSEDSSENKEHWIKTDADYLVLEL